MNLISLKKSKLILALTAISFAGIIIPFEGYFSPAQAGYGNIFKNIREAGRRRNPILTTPKKTDTLAERVRIKLRTQPTILERAKPNPIQGTRTSTAGKPVTGNPTFPTTTPIRIRPLTRPIPNPCKVRQQTKKDDSPKSICERKTDNNSRRN